MNRMTTQIEGWDKDKVTGLMWKTCGADTRAAGQSLLTTTVAGALVLKTRTMPEQAYKRI